MAPRSQKAISPSAKDDQSIYQLKITLNHVKPSVWRRILVPASIMLPKLHDALQASMGWLDCHLHEFNDKYDKWGVPDPDGWSLDDDLINESRIRLNSILSEEKSSIEYAYDFGDGWTHKIVLEKILKESPVPRLPWCVAGARACPPEDCGGPWGYAELLEIIADPSHDRYEELSEWLSDDFDPERFDLDEVNECLSPPKKARKPK